MNSKKEYMFCANQEILQSRNCIEHSQNQEIVVHISRAHQVGEAHTWLESINSFTQRENGHKASKPTTQRKGKEATNECRAPFTFSSCVFIDASVRTSNLGAILKL